MYVLAKLLHVSTLNLHVELKVNVHLVRCCISAVRPLALYICPQNRRLFVGKLQVKNT